MSERYDPTGAGFGPEARRGFARSADGTQIYYEQTGAGPPLVLCDGIGCDGFAWRYITRHFAARHRLVHWHNRCHGQSGVPEDQSHLGIEHLAQDLDAVLAACGVERPVLLGHSMGVQVAVHHALTRSVGQRALILICGAPGRPLATWHDASYGQPLQRLLQLSSERLPTLTQLAWSAFTGSGVGLAYAKAFEVNGWVVRDEDFWPYFRGLAQLDAGLFFRMAGMINEHSNEPRLGELRLPTLIISGDRDTFTPSWLSRKMHRLIPGSELMELRGGTHTAPIEFPEPIILRIEKFLAELPTGGEHAPPPAA